jgi:hypothetical protein
MLAEECKSEIIFFYIETGYTDGTVTHLNIKKCDRFRCFLLSFGDLFCLDSGLQGTVKGT